MNDLLSFTLTVVNAHFSAQELVEKHGPSDRDVEGPDFTQHRDADKKIAFLLNQRPNPVTFTAQDNSQPIGKIPRVKVLFGLSVKTYDPETLLL
jgi:hypothetical protein